MNEKEAIRVLGQVTENLDKHGIEYWLDMGTLLGAIREKKFIPWDHDIDLGTWHGNAIKIRPVSKELHDKGFEIYFYDYHISIQKGEVPVNISLYCLSNDKAIKTWYVSKRTMLGEIRMFLAATLLSQNHSKVHNMYPMATSVSKIIFRLSHILPHSLRWPLAKIMRTSHPKIGLKCVKVLIPSHYFMNLSTIRFYGMEFKVPAEVEEYLAYRYSKDWRVPKKDYIYYQEDRAICRQ